MPSLILMAVLMVGPEPWVVTERVAQLEVQHVYDNDGRWLFTQTVYRAEAGTIIDFRIVKAREQLPIGKRAVWMEGNVIRKVVATSVNEWHGQLDVEVAERELLPKEQRRDLMPIVGWKRAKDLMSK